MPVAPEAVDKFLGTVHAEPLKTKGLPPDELRQIIYDCTGQEFEEVTPSRPHQLEGTAFALYQQRALLFFWMRLGKTKMSLDWCTHLRRSNLVRKKGIVITHAPIGSDVWMGQIKAHSRLKAVVVRAGPTASDAFCDALDDDTELIIISRSVIQALFTFKKKGRKGVNKLYPDREKLDLAASYFDHAVIDETHFYSNPDGLPFILASAMVQKCKFRIGLTGTPVGRDPFKIWAQASLIDDGRHFGFNYRFFQAAFGRAEYAHFAPRQERLVFDKKKLDLFQYKLDAFSMSYGKNDIKGATVLKGVVKIQMHPEQRDAYNGAVRELLKARLENQRVEMSFTRMRQIASGFMNFVDDDGDDQRVHFPSAKMEWLTEFVSEIPPDAQVLIFHEFIHTGELICKMLTDAKISNVPLRGETLDKPAAVEMFNSGKAQFMVANATAGGTGIDLPAADYLLFYESPCSPQVRAQAAARPMNRGDRLLVLDDLICSPVEEKILGFISSGEELLAKLLRGGSKSAHDLFA